MTSEPPGECFVYITLPGMISALTLVRAEDNHQSRDRWSYVQLAEELRRVSSTPGNDAAELFRRMCFNALISNLDDHPRNHALVAKNKDWTLSPAYDLTPAVPISTEHCDLAMECGDAGRFANADNLLSQSGRFSSSASVPPRSSMQWRRRSAPPGSRLPGKLAFRLQTAERWRARLCTTGSGNDPPRGAEVDGVAASFVEAALAPVCSSRCSKRVVRAGQPIMSADMTLPG